MRAMEALVASGKIRFLGVSNFDVEDVQAAEQALSKERLAANQVLYHLGDRGIERRLIPYCAERGIAVVGYSPFGHAGFPAPGSRGGKAAGRGRGACRTNAPAGGAELLDPGSRTSSPFPRLPILST